MRRTGYLVELMNDIDMGRIQPLTSVKNIEGILAEFVDEYDSYEDMLKDLEEWNYIKC
jgi:hypothetical protein